AIALRNTEEVFHVLDREVGHAPGPSLPGRAQIFERLHDMGKVGHAVGPVQQIQIEIIRAETGEAFLARPRDTVARHMTGRDFRHQEYAIALTGYHTADRSFGAAFAVDLRRVDHRHAERQAGA